MKFSYGIIRSLAFLTTCVLGLTVFTLRLSAQSADQLQALQYERFRDFVQTMDVVVNDDDFTFKGKAKAEFTNNTGDTLHCLYFHAHFNAFQPGSPTYNRVATIGPNRLKPEIFANLKPNEIGKLDITQGTLNGQTVTVSRTWTIIRVDGIKPIAPQEKISFEFEFAGQVPVQIRRSGRNNAQGVRYSMAQWFPKLCQYDQHGWHNNQFVLREFYGVWGKYDVHLTLPAKLVVGASGVLQNPQEIGHGYQFDRDTTVVPSQQSTPSTTKTWHFIAFPVHDFAWTADEDYVHTIVRATAPMSSANNDLTFHILYRSKYTAQWAAVGTWLKGTFSFMGKNYFPYPYKTFTCTQAGDGGMEYPNLVMLKSDYGSSFRGTVIHESIHQWFYGIAANNETKHGWMDEGLTDYMTDRVDAEEFGFPAASAPSSTLGNWLVPVRKENIERNRSFLRVCAFGYDEPLITPHDRYNEDMTAVMVYKKGSSWLRQFEYSFGKEKVDAALRLYLDRWKYRHPYPVDFERVCEDVFGQRMDEVFDTMLYGTELPDYSLRQLTSTPEGGKWRTIVDIAKGERAHVPLNLFATDYAGITQNFRIPSDIPQSSAYAPDATKPTTNSLPIWFWTDKYYRASFLADHEIQSVRLDTAGNLLRVNLPNQAPC